ncbi:hypothetical protein [Mesorhizobium sp. M4B.F.Ca.ET.017.02.2.1]|uniref:winged helix domain-containing protein n=1 Tax=Mesorhizobium sp. M4B.F.Ca.ET.017.02.2.1 TaxID=2496649 RepID=UPI000FCA3400|nr:hypothetical protein [Mesorhizobium sp. M4B.F.Ca.ET.017.02.2.1]RVD31439.1 hypothetical protein EN738_01930 [Mesorhizobium sp. M4B.F.Ca.ET.017.02.2.1]
MKYTILVKVEPDGATMRLDGRVAWAIKKLIDAGKGGCTPITHPGPRWSDYVHKARALGFVIETIHESHGGHFAGHHGRYVLHTEVSILEDMAVAA